MTEYLQPLLANLVHEEQRYPTIGLEIPDADVLFIASQIDKSNGVVAEDAQKALGAPSILNVRPSGLADGCHVKTITLHDEFLFIGTQDVPVLCEVLDTLVLSPTPMHLLVSLHLRSESNRCEAPSHASLRPQWTVKPVVSSHAP